MSIEFIQIHHASLVVKDLLQSMTFYSGVLGLQPNSLRPDMGYPGVWLDIGMQQIHLMQVASQELPLQDHLGHERHLAIQVLNLDTVEQRLSAAGIEYRKSRSGRAALFCRDPDHNTLEFVEKIG